MRANFQLGDCLTVLRCMGDERVDSLVTDPPAGISFMGKDWDSDKGGRDEWIAWMSSVMTECLRVLKPGGHALVWAIPRTSHWTMTALENAGFEIRDVVTHLFGTGFPKSLDVSKAIDKAAGAERPVIGKIASPASTKRVQTMGRPEHSGSGWNEAPDLTAPATDDAKRWQGFGTALKPACEFWVLCRKPLGEKTVAAKWEHGGRRAPQRVPNRWHRASRRLHANRPPAHRRPLKRGSRGPDHSCGPDRQRRGPPSGAGSARRVLRDRDELAPLRNSL